MWTNSIITGYTNFNILYSVESFYLALFFTSSSLTGLAQKPSLVTRSGQAYFGKLEAKVAGSTLVTPILKDPDQSDSSGLPMTDMQ